MSVPGAPTLSTADIEAIRTSEVARTNLEKSTNWYLGFPRLSALSSYRVNRHICYTGCYNSDNQGCIRYRA